MERLNRAAAFAFGASLVGVLTTTACGGSAATDSSTAGAPNDAQAGTLNTGGTPSSGGVYGAPIAGSGTSTGGAPNGGAVYGAPIAGSGGSAGAGGAPNGGAIYGAPIAGSGGSAGKSGAAGGGAAGSG